MAILLVSDGVTVMPWATLDTTLRAERGARLLCECTVGAETMMRTSAAPEGARVSFGERGGTTKGARFPVRGLKPDVPIARPSTTLRALGVEPARADGRPASAALRYASADWTRAARGRV